MQEHDVVGIGNAIVDIIARCDDAFLARHGCTQGQHAAGRCGGRRASSTTTWDRPWRSPAARSPTPWSASPRSAAGPASSARRPSDQFGQVFGHDIRTAGVTFTTPPAAPGQRAHRPLPGPGDAGRPAHHEHLPRRQPAARRRRGGRRARSRSARIVYLEGYLFDRPEAKAAFRQAAEIAAKAGRQVALTPVRSLLRRPPPGRVPAS